jgi:glycosyltransferase involved in cell wall biosynthesis
LGAPLRVVYVSYDGALDPLGASQVVPYLLGLARRGVELTLISFEKPDRLADFSEREALRQRLAAARILWRPLAYHWWPRLPATLWDGLAGARAVRAELRASAVDLVHCRGEVAMTMARWARPPHGTPLLYDMRGFYADERVESGSWSRGSWIDRWVRRSEAENLRRCAGVVVLTQAAHDVLREQHPQLSPLEVIPTCVDTARFAPASPETPAPEFGLAYCGSLGTWYLSREMVEFAREARALLPERPLFLTPQPEQALRAGATPDWAEVRSVPPSEVPGWLRRCRALLFFIRPTPAKRASCPTKLAEALATGLPIVANAGIGDLDRLVEAERVGVLVKSFGSAAYREALERLRHLLEDPSTPQRCRALAVSGYSLDRGVEAYVRIYDEMIAQPERASR